MFFDGKAGDGLAGCRDAVDNPTRPGRLDTDDHARCHVGVRPRTDERAEEQLEILTELQPAVGMRKRQRALDVVRDRLACGIRKVVERKNDYMITNADPPVFPPVPIEIVASHVTTFWSSDCARARGGPSECRPRHDPRRTRTSAPCRRS